jgi:hypothetical protein
MANDSLISLNSQKDNGKERDSTGFFNKASLFISGLNNNLAKNTS